MFTNRLPWVMLLLGWMAGATWWHVCTIRQLCSDDVPAVSPPPVTTTTETDSAATPKPAPVLVTVETKPVGATPVTEASLAAK